MSYKNLSDPQDLPCWRTCRSCNRCANKGVFVACQSCSGRRDPRLQRDCSDVDDFCKCAQGILRYRTKQGVLVEGPLPGNPFEGSMISEPNSEDERDWERYVDEQRERFDDPYFDPIHFD